MLQTRSMFLIHASLNDLHGRNPNFCKLHEIYFKNEPFWCMEFIIFFIIEITNIFLINAC